MSLERRGHAEFDFFDREVRQGRHDKTFQYLFTALLGIGE